MKSTTVSIAVPLPNSDESSQYTNQPLATAPPPPIEDNYEPPPSYISATSPQSQQNSNNRETLQIPQTYNISYNNPPQNPLDKEGITITETHYIESPPENAKLQRTWRYGKTTKLFSFIDSFFCIFTGIFGNPYLLFIAILPLSGYYGSKDYSLIKICMYLLYIFAICFFKGVDIYNIVERKYDYLSDSSDDTIIGLTVLNSVYLLVELWIFKVVNKFYNCLIRLTEDELETMRRGNYKPFITTYQFT